MSASVLLGKVLMQSKYPTWYRSRRYLHFDLPISVNRAVNLVTNPYLVSKHAFFPLINYEITSKKIEKDKSNNKIITKTKKRPISYSSHVDSHIYAYYSQILSLKYEEKVRSANLESSILAFRQLGKNNIDFAFEAFNEIKKMGRCSAVALDLSKFFDNLDHSILKSSWAKLLESQKLPNDHFAVFKSLTSFSQVDKINLYSNLGISLNNPRKDRRRVCTAKEFRDIVRKNGLIETNKKTCGIPQGSPISALLSNIYMLDFDIKMKKYVEKIGGKYFRYCDDMLFIVPQEIRDKVAGIAQIEIKSLKVTINTKKTELRTFSYKGSQLCADQMLQYLGFMFDGENIFIRSSSLARFSEKMKRGIRLAKKTKAKHDSIRIRKGLTEKQLYKRKLYSRYTHLGGRNFVTYGLRAANIMKSKSIKRQLKPLWRKFKEEIDKN